MTNLQEIIPKLKKLTLMLSSQNDGEVVAAARSIERAIKSAGADWHDFVNLLDGSKLHTEKKTKQEQKSEQNSYSQSSGPKANYYFSNWEEAWNSGYGIFLVKIALRQNWITEWEREFLENIDNILSKSLYPLTIRQIAVLDRIIDKSHKYGLEA